MKFEYGFGEVYEKRSGMHAPSLYQPSISSSKWGRICNIVGYVASLRQRGAELVLSFQTVEGFGAEVTPHLR